MNQATKPYFSIVIPTLNEERFLPSLLDDLTEQTWTDFEVIHVDGHSDDATVRLAKKFATHHRLNLRTLNCDQRNASTQRNLGASQAAGQWIVFVDADTRLDKTFFADIHNNIKKARAKRKQLDSFSTLLKLNDTDAKRLSYHVGLFLTNLGILCFAGTRRPRAVGYMIGVRRAVFGRVQFDENLRFAEDTQFITDVKRLGYAFTIFRHPLAKFSMRRFDGQSALASCFKVLKLQMKVTLNQPVDSSEYEMSGGTNYGDGDAKPRPHKSRRRKD